jgi:uncharacterized protein YdaT
MELNDNDIPEQFRDLDENVKARAVSMFYQLMDQGMDEPQAINMAINRAHHYEGNPMNRGDVDRGDMEFNN